MSTTRIRREQPCIGPPREAARRGIGLILVRAYSTSTYGVPLVGLAPVAPFTAAHDEAMRVLSGATESAAESAPDVVASTLAINGSAAAVLADEASRAEMLVIGTEGHHQFIDVTLGSVANRLAGTIVAPVVIVRPKHSGPDSDGRPVVVGQTAHPSPPAQSNSPSTSRHDVGAVGRCAGLERFGVRRLPAGLPVAGRSRAGRS